MNPLSKVFLLQDALSPTELASLRSLTYHESYPVIKKLFVAIVRVANDSIASVDPDEADYEKKLANRANRARLTKEICEGLLKSIDHHAESLENSIKHEKGKPNAGPNSVDA